MQTIARPPEETQSRRPQVRQKRRRNLLLPMLIGSLVTVLITIGTFALVFNRTDTQTRAAEANANCTIIVPDQPLTAKGLATPYQLVATNPKNGPCHEGNPDQAAFVQGAVVDLATGKISIYNPLVVDKGTRPAVAPVVPKLPANAIVALWFGYNGDTLTLKGASKQALMNGKCVNGLKNSIFGQYAYCNAPTFFAAANLAIAAKKLVPPALGVGKDGLPCPSVRDFGIVDQDQSDNVTTTYLVDKKGRTAQMNAANTAALDMTQTLVNGSDNRLVSIALAGALGCKSWTAPDLADPGHNVTAQPLNELQAAAHQQNPVALIPSNDPMVTVDGKPSLEKLNAYRIGVDQGAVQNIDQASGRTYCTNFLNQAPRRIQIDAPILKNIASPDPAAANNLFTFLAQRFVNSWGADGLNCQNILQKQSPITLKQEGDVTVDATIKGVKTFQTVNCTVNGQRFAGCNANIVINNQACTFTTQNNEVTLTCPAQDQQKQPLPAQPKDPKVQPAQPQNQPVQPVQGQTPKQ